MVDAGTLPPTFAFVLLRLLEDLVTIGLTAVDDGAPAPLVSNDP